MLGRTSGLTGESSSVGCGHEADSRDDDGGSGVGWVWGI